MKRDRLGERMEENFLKRVEVWEPFLLQIFNKSLKLLGKFFSELKHNWKLMVKKTDKLFEIRMF